MSRKPPTIEVHQDGPYVVKGLAGATSSQGDRVDLSVAKHICRCGKSRNKPYCDKSHVAYGFSSHKLEGRQEDRVDRYEGKEITILDNRGVCSHRGHCTTHLPSVFRQGREPWIDPDGAEAEEVERVIRMCPSGALAFERNGRTERSWTKEPGLVLVKNGPMEVSGGIALRDEEGSRPETEDHYALCRCGGSKNKPFCDGSHWYNGFSDEKDPLILARQIVSPTSRPQSDEIFSSRFGGQTGHVTEIQTAAALGRPVIEPMGPLGVLPSWDDVTVRGAQLARLPVNEDEPVRLTTVIGPRAAKPLEISLPVFVTHMSFGALSREAKIALAKGSAKARTAMCSGEGGIVEESLAASHKYIFEYVQNEYSVSEENLRRCDAVEIKIGQAVKPGIGGHFPAAKLTEEIAAIRGKPLGQDIVTPARYSDIFDVSSLARKIQWLRELSGGLPVGVKIAAGRIEEDLAVVVPAGPDYITLDGRGGATASVVKAIKDSASVPTLYAVARAGRYLREHSVEGISLVVTGGLRISSDFVKAIALGADAVAIGTAALIAIGCRQYRLCNTGRCPTGIATQDPSLRARLDVEESADRLARFFEVTRAEMEAFTRMCGHSEIASFTPHDLATQDCTIAEATEIAFA